MNLTKNAVDWLQKTSHLLKEIFPQTNYVVLEGLPCSGKTSVLNVLKKNKIIVIDELRLERNSESTFNYLTQEINRKKRIINNNYDSQIILGDRSIISTITFEAARLSYNSSKINETNFACLEDLCLSKEIVMPSTIIYFDVSIENSRLRQELRDRDILEGRLWYEKDFLNLIKEANEFFLSTLVKDSNLTSYRLNSNTLDLDTMYKETFKILNGKNG